MSVDDPMTIDERRKYLRKMQTRYWEAERRGRIKLLDEMEAVTGLHRKSLIRLIRGDLSRKPRRRQRGPSYGLGVSQALGVIAQSTDYLCAERLQPNLVWMAQHLAQHGELEASPSLLEKLGRISLSTVRRLLKDIPQDLPRLPRKGPQQANRYARGVPARRIPWDTQDPGHFEVDLVHHCGVSPSGHYLHSLQLVDVATDWSERAATLGRSYRVIQDAFERVQSRLPFPIKEIHPDNDSAFFNRYLMEFWSDQARGIRLSRSRPYDKNDNRFVEQKNDTLIRAYLGYFRLDTAEQTNHLNRLYDRMWLYYNFFQPVMRLKEKRVIASAGGRTRTRRSYDQAQTPFDRLRATEALPPEAEERLLALRDGTNPRRLREEIYTSLDQLFDLPGADPQRSEDVYLTLFGNGGGKEEGDSPVLAELASLETLSFEGTVIAR